MPPRDLHPVHKLFCVRVHILSRNLPLHISNQTPRFAYRIINRICHVRKGKIQKHTKTNKRSSCMEC